MTGCQPGGPSLGEDAMEERIASSPPFLLPAALRADPEVGTYGSRRPPSTLGGRRSGGSGDEQGCSNPGGPHAESLRAPGGSCPVRRTVGPGEEGGGMRRAARSRSVCSRSAIVPTISSSAWRSPRGSENRWRARNRRASSWWRRLVCQRSSRRSSMVALIPRVSAGRGSRLSLAEATGLREQPTRPAAAGRGAGGEGEEPASGLLAPRRNPGGRRFPTCWGEESHRTACICLISQR